MDGKTDAGVTDTQPLLHSCLPHAGIAIAVEQSVAVLLENGPGFSVLFGKRFSAQPDNGCAFIQDCTQYRIQKDGKTVFRYFAEVMFGHDKERKLFYATPDQGNSLFSQPSLDPYAVLELSKIEADKIDKYIKSRSHDDLFGILQNRFGSLPGFFAPNKDELRAPDNYASSKGDYPNEQTFIN